MTGSGAATAGRGRPRRGRAGAALLALGPLVAACSGHGLPQPGWSEVPSSLLDDPPAFEILSPGPDVPASVARFSGIWIAGLPGKADGRSLIAVTYVAADGDVQVERAVTGRVAPGMPLWQWTVSRQWAHVAHGTLALAAGRWLSVNDTAPPTMQEHVWSNDCVPGCPPGASGLVFSRVPP